MKIHDLLSISEDSDTEVVKKKFKFSCPHPDRGGTIEQWQEYHEAYQEWEASLVEETKEATFLRFVTQKALKRNYEQSCISFTNSMLLEIDVMIAKEQKKLQEVQDQRLAFIDSLSEAKARIDNEEVLKIVVSEIEKQLKGVPDIIEFISAEIVFYKEIKKSIRFRYTTKKQRTTAEKNQHLKISYNWEKQLDD